MRKKTTAQFIVEAQAKHGYLYEYSRSEYISARDDIEIICDIHGSFWQAPDKHINRGQGCPRCVGMNKDTAIFIEEARAIHGDRYNYEKSVYTRGRDDLEIICKIHGSFWQTPAEHIHAGSGCCKCSRIVDTTTFIAAARIKHGDLYDYSSVNYVNSAADVEIICKIHGSFWQRPTHHVSSGSGCQECGGSEPKDTLTFIDEAKAKHGDLYDYSRSKYIRSHDDVEIICKIHGSFLQSPADHLRGNKGVGSRCPKCRPRRIADTVRQYHDFNRRIKLVGVMENFQKTPLINEECE